MHQNIIKTCFVLIFMFVTGMCYADKIDECSVKNSPWVSRGVVLFYKGECKDGFAHGNGILKFESGANYEGEWKNGFRDGKGIHTWKNGNQYIGVY